jgi:hypothetical protein
MREREIFRNYFGPENAGSRVPSSPHDSPVMAVAHVGAPSLAKCRRLVVIGAGAANATMAAMRTTVGLSALLVAFSALVYACGSADLSSFGADSANPSATGGGTDAGFGGATSAPSGDKALAPVDNAVILVHAAKSQSFRLCFENETDRRPQPDSQVMPEANVVGVEVGSAVRLAPLRGKPGMVYLYEEPLIRAFYPAFGGAGAGPTCKNLLENTNLQKLAQPLGAIDTDLSHGVHLVVVRGCPSDSPLRKYSAAECGDGWAAATGNLTVKEITLTGATRPGDGILPAQVVNLSQPLESARAKGNVLVTFGDLTAPSATHTTVTANPTLFGEAQPSQPAQLPYNSSDIAIYESVGFRVSLLAADAGADAGAGKKVLDESLALIQKQSSPRDVPPSYYSAASNYALLLLGDPDAKLADGGPDTDERRTLHFLAVPVIEPKNDGGAEGGTTDPLDGGAAPTTP